GAAGVPALGLGGRPVGLLSLPELVLASLLLPPRPPLVSAPRPGRLRAGRGAIVSTAAGWALTSGRRCVCSAASNSAARPPGDVAMAKPASIKIRLNSSADTGFFYVTKKNARTKTDKLVLKKYDPIARKHVEFKEGKIK